MPNRSLGTWRSRTLTAWETQIAERARQLTVLLVALESRYLPVLERGWLHVKSDATEQWKAFAQHFDPAAVLVRLNRDPADLLRSADDLLFGARRIDPLGHHWSELLRRARRTWDDLSGDALVALDHRIAAEILLLCYEDLAARGTVAPLTERNDLFHTEQERISYRPRQLDTNLSSLGLSPHPGVILVVEGETEEILVPLVRDHIRIPSQAEVIQSVVLRGVSRDLTKLAAFASAPLLGEKVPLPRENQGDAWVAVKPPTRLLVVVDPDPPYNSPENIEKERQRIVEEIVLVVRAQGVEPNRDDVNSLVSVKTWSESCFEFAHFTDDELAEALLKLHGQCGGLDQASLVAALRRQRDHRCDIKNVWKHWRPEPSKKDLARELWPVLRRKLDAAASGTTPDPPIAEVLFNALGEAVQRPHGIFVLRGTEIVR